MIDKVLFLSIFMAESDPCEVQGTSEHIADKAMVSFPAADADHEQRINDLNSIQYMTRVRLLFTAPSKNMN